MRAPTWTHALYFDDTEKAAQVVVRPTARPIPPTGSRDCTTTPAPAIRERRRLRGHGDAAAGRVPADDGPLLDGALAGSARAVPGPSLRRQVLRIPPATRTRGSDLKYLLRKAVADLLPRELLGAPKRGFVLPASPWLRGTLRPLVERLLSPERLARQGLCGRRSTSATSAAPGRPRGTWRHKSGRC